MSDPAKASAATSPPADDKKLVKDEDGFISFFKQTPEELAEEEASEYK